MADSPEAIKKSQKLYLLIGLVLFVGTGLTVAVATIPGLDIGGHGFDKHDMVLGLLIASTKAMLVALIFMHLNHEKKWIYLLFSTGLVMAVAMAGLIFLADFDPIHYEGFWNGSGE